MHTFTYTPDPENHFDHVKVTVQTETTSLTDVVSAFESYLKAAGFCFGNAHLEFADDEGDGAPGKSELSEQLRDALNDSP